VTPLLLGLPWAHHALPTPTPWWAHVIAAASALALAAWTAAMAGRQARKKMAKLVPFRPRRR